GSGYSAPGRRAVMSRRCFSRGWQQRQGGGAGACAPALAGLCPHERKLPYCELSTFRLLTTRSAPTTRAASCSTVDFSAGVLTTPFNVTVPFSATIFALCA